MGEARKTSTIAIIQARMRSTRLPGKVLRDIAGHSMLDRVVSRTQMAKSLNKVLVATTVESVDEPIVAECARLDIPVFRGSENDVLDRYCQAAQVHQAQVVVRITADCPLIEPNVIDRVVNVFQEASADYASNTLERTFPIGLDAEVMTIAALQSAWYEATEPYQRVHVTPYIYEHPDLYALVSVTHDHDISTYRWTVDTVEDLEFVRSVYDRLGPERHFDWNAVLNLLENEPGLADTNRGVRQKKLREG